MERNICCHMSIYVYNRRYIVYVRKQEKPGGGVAVMEK